MVAASVRKFLMTYLAYSTQDVPVKREYNGSAGAANSANSASSAGAASSTGSANSAGANGGGPTTEEMIHDTSQMIEVLERHRTVLPFADAELVHYQRIRNELEQQRAQSEKALASWRGALNHRWECEVAGQRLFMQMSDKLRHVFGDDSPCLHVITPTDRDGHSTADDLLVDLHRLEASLMLIQPPLDGTSGYLKEITSLCNSLQSAIGDTRYWEEQRRSAVVGQRLVYDAYQRTCSKTRRLITEHLGEQALQHMSSSC